MTQDEKAFILRDLCARLPYSVKVEYDKCACEVLSIDMFHEELTIWKCPGCYPDIELENTKPYLFPLSSISEDQKYDFYCRFIKNDCNFDDFKFYLYTGMWRRKLLTLTSIDDIETIIDWFHKNHIDWRGLIPMGLAIDATGLNIY